MSADASPGSAGPSEPQRRATDLLRAAMEARGADAAEDAINESYRATLHRVMVPMFIELAEARWHERHEDVASALQLLKPPEAVSVLETLAETTYEYLAYDESKGLARKCTWALADIGTQEARVALERLAESPEPHLVEFARKRLENWDAERDRKGAADS